MSVTAGKQRALLAILLVNRGRALDRDWLVDALWDGRPAATAQKVLAQYVWRLRGLLPEGCELCTTPSGYALEVSDDDVDSGRFVRLVEEARAVTDAGDVERAIGRYTEALTLWRGPALSDVRSLPVLEAEAVRLDKRRAEVSEALAELHLACGRHAEALPVLEELTAAEPYRERPWRLLMLALYRAGRRPDALAAFQRMWRVWVDELAVEPSGELRSLHQRILTDDPTLTDEPTVPGAPTPTTPVVARPAQLPADLPSFVGRAAELDQLLAVLGDGRGGGQTAGTVVISAIDGMAGVGKTVLVVHAAHRLASRFPDGQLFLDLHGYTDGVSPVTPADALDRMLRALGVPGSTIPVDLDERAALLRSVLAGRRLLMVLDNAVNESQVRPLIPGTPGCLTIITSRRRLVGLEGARPVSLDVLPTADAVALFARASGVGEPVEVLTEIVELCGRLPLAIGIAAARLRNRPTWTPAHLAERLRNQRHRLVELDAGDRSVAAAIDLSYQHLTADQQRAFRLLGLHPGVDVEPYAAAALVDTTVPRARRLLDDLVDAHLLTEHTPGRYQFHDLVRAHAAAVAEQHEPAPDRRAAVGRLFDLYSRTAAAAVDLVYPHDADRRPTLPPPRAAVPRLVAPTAATDWLDRELANMLAAAERATPYGLSDYTVAMSAILYRHLRVRGHVEPARRLHQHALEAARATGDRTGELNALVNVGYTLGACGELDQADGYLRQALASARRLGHVAGELAALLALGALACYRAHHDLATTWLEQALRIARTAGKAHSELRALGNLGNIHRLQGRIEAATDCYQQAVAIARTVGERNDELKALVGLGHMYRLQRRFDVAGDTYQQALATARDIGAREAELHALWGVAAIHRHMGRLESALACFDELLELARRLGNRNSQFEAYHGLGHTHRDAGRPERAITWHQQALRIAQDLDQPDDQARAHDGIALAHHALGHRHEARKHWQLALDLLTACHLTQVEEVDVDEVRARLAEVASD